MEYAISQILSDVKVALDCNDLSEALVEAGDPETLQLDQIIESKIEGAARAVHRAAPYTMLEKGHNFGDAIYWGADGRGWIVLPENFERLIVFEMSDWERPVYTAVDCTDPGYAKMRSRHKGISGSPQRPACAIATRPVGLVLEFYSCNDNTAQVQRAMYTPIVKIQQQRQMPGNVVMDYPHIDMSEQCYQAMVYMCAAMAAQTYGDTEKAKAMEELCALQLK